MVLCVCHTVSEVRMEKVMFTGVRGNSLERTTVSTAYGQSKVFIPNNWDHTQVLRDLGVVLSVQNTQFLRAGTLSLHLLWQHYGAGEQ